MDLNFYNVAVPAEMAADHAKQGGQGLWRIAADLPHLEQLRVMVGKEPIEFPVETSPYKLHLSASVGKIGAIEPCRRPTDEELATVLKLWAGKIDFKEESEITHDPMVRHCWEP